MDCLNRTLIQSFFLSFSPSYFFLRQSGSLGNRGYMMFLVKKNMMVGCLYAYLVVEVFSNSSLRHATLMQ